MANLMLAPVWSMGWKVAIIVILAFLLLLCVALAVYIIVTHRRAKRREVEDDFDLPDDGGFSKIVRAEDYGVTMPPDYSLSAERMRTHSEVQHIQTGGGYVNAAPLGQTVQKKRPLRRAPVQWPSARDGGRRIGASADLA